MTKEDKQLKKLYNYLSKVNAIQFLGACRILNIPIFPDTPVDRPCTEGVDFGLLRPTEDLIVELTQKFLDLDQPAQKRYLKLLKAAKKVKPDGSQDTAENSPKEM